MLNKQLLIEHRGCCVVTLVLFWALTTLEMLRYAGAVTSTPCYVKITPNATLLTWYDQQDVPSTKTYPCNRPDFCAGDVAIRCRYDRVQPDAYVPCDCEYLPPDTPDIHQPPFKRDVLCFLVSVLHLCLSVVAIVVLFDDRLH